MKRNERGFTFYEVLIVLLVMGIVAAGSIWLTQFARGKRYQADLAVQSLKLAVEAARSEALNGVEEVERRTFDASRVVLPPGVTLQNRENRPIAFSVAGQPITLPATGRIEFAPQSGNAEVSTTSNWGAIYVWSAQEQRQLALVVPKLPGPVQIFRFERDARVGWFPQNSSVY